MTRDEVEARVRAIMVELFELDPAVVTPEANVFEDLDLDSIDAIDLVARLQQLTGSRVSEDAVKAVRTVDDIITLAVTELARKQSDGPNVSNVADGSEQAAGADDPAPETSDGPGSPERAPAGS